MNPEISSTALHQKLRSFADVITGNDSYFGEIYHALQGLHDLLVSIGGVNANASVTKGTVSGTGYAVSPGEAARCIFDLSRTVKFGRGLIRAIQHQLTRNTGRPVAVLYAGCGPYALLFLLIVPYFTKEEIQFTFVDIHEASVSSAEKLLKAFGVEDHVEAITAADATTYNPEKKFDILLSETMQNALRKEPQVAIVTHLVQFLNDNGIMVPESISVKPVFVETNIRNVLMKGESAEGFVSPAVVEHEMIGELNIATAKRVSPFPKKTILFDPAFLSANYCFELCTAIKVWENETLTGFDCGITLPFKIAEADTLAGKRGASFTYIHDDDPHFECEIF